MAAPPRTVTADPSVGRRSPEPARAFVTAILVVHDGARWLGECLDSLVRQQRRPDRLVIVDTGSTDASVEIVAGHGRLRAAISETQVLTLDRHTSFGDAVARAVGTLPGAPAGAPSRSATEASADAPGDASGEAPADAPGDASGEAPAGADWLWLLHDDSAAEPAALAALLDTAGRSRSVGIAGPKLTTWDDPHRLLEVGVHLTRTGRRAGGPAVGERDQGQHDHRGDVLAVSSSGMLVRRDVYTDLHGFDPTFARSGGDLDLSWRAHLAGHRVVVVPAAKVREAAASLSGIRGPEPGAHARRVARRRERQVALTRCAPWVVPFLALWIALTCLAAGLALLAVKRPRRAVAELADLGALLTPWRQIAARWRARGQRRMRRRDLRGLFVPTRAALRHTVDQIHDAVDYEGRRPQPAATPAEQLETGPVAAEAEALTVLPASWPERTVRHPGFLAVLGATALTIAAWRGALTHGSLASLTGGLSGGELLPVTTDAAGLWHAWLDGWHGSGLGGAGETGPYLGVLAALSWLLEHVPVLGSPASPVGLLLTGLFLAAIPLSAWTAYLASRVATANRWPRAWAALAWASLATLSTALGSGRLGAAVAHILLPLVAAGFAVAARRGASVATTFGTVLGIAVLGAFNPALLAVAALAALLLLLLGRGTARLRALPLLVLPTALLGPWALRLLDEPRLLLAGPGLTAWGQAEPLPWHLALLHPGGPGSYPVLVAVPLVLVGLVALLRRGRRSGAMTALGLLALLGLALGLAAPRVTIGHDPATGAAITPWSGTGLDLLALALVAAALVGQDGLSLRLAGGRLRAGTEERADAATPATEAGAGAAAPNAAKASGTGRRWRRPLAAALVTIAVLGVLASAVLAGWRGVGDLVRATPTTMPAVASDGAFGPLANRLLVLSGSDRSVSYRLVGREPGAPARDLPVTAQRPDAALASAVQAAVEPAGVAHAGDANDRLFALGVGFVGYDGPVSSPLVRRLDSTAGLARLSNSRGLVLWRVLPQPAASGAATVAPARARLQDANGAQLSTVDVSGAHGRLSAAVPAGAAGRQLVLAEPPGWVSHARVAYDGRVLPAVPGAAAPTYAVPPSAGRLTVEVLPTDAGWRWGQLALFGVCLFLAVPIGGRRNPRTSRTSRTSTRRTA